MYLEHMRGQVGHFINYKQPKPTVGMAVTLLHYTDRSVGRIERISKTGKTIWFREDKATRTDKNGMSESQSYSYEANPDGKVYKATLRKDKQWRTSNINLKAVLGEQDAYHDYSF